ncbi:hypothetical protein JKP88DRAFT_242668 [Tribonema minus]|uniref:Uncharacterized protein n=1 Tax=Tribonema minus TaxID=303371 RepID=A0A835ZH64_9STRA|nr:hypothetical protein JKP88DRAFT_242668 [Tribonema minus]
MALQLGQALGLAVHQALPVDHCDCSYTKQIERWLQMLYTARSKQSQPKSAAFCRCGQSCFWRRTVAAALAALNFTCQWLKAVSQGRHYVKCCDAVRVNVSLHVLSLLLIEHDEEAHDQGGTTGTSVVWSDSDALPQTTVSTHGAPMVASVTVAPTPHQQPQLPVVQDALQQLHNDCSNRMTSFSLGSINISSQVWQQHHPSSCSCRCFCTRVALPYTRGARASVPAGGAALGMASTLQVTAPSFTPASPPPSQQHVLSRRRHSLQQRLLDFQTARFAISYVAADSAAVHRPCLGRGNERRAARVPRPNPRSDFFCMQHARCSPRRSNACAGILCVQHESLACDTSLLAHAIICTGIPATPSPPVPAPSAVRNVHVICITKEKDISPQTGSRKRQLRKVNTGKAPVALEFVNPRGSTSVRMTSAGGGRCAARNFKINTNSTTIEDTPQTRAGAQQSSATLALKCTRSHGAAQAGKEYRNLNAVHIMVPLPSRNVTEGEVAT